MCRQRLSLALLAAVLCLSAHADNVARVGENKYETLQEAVDAVSDGGSEATTIQLLANTTITSSVTITNKNIVLDLGGYTLTGNSSSELKMLLITNSSDANDASTVTVQNGTIATAEGTQGRGIRIEGNYNTLTVASSVTINTNQGSGSSYAISVKGNYNQVTVKGGTYTTTGYALAYVGASNTLTVEDGTFTAGMGLFGNGTEGYSGNTINISGGTFTVDAGFHFPNDDIVTVENCTINATDAGIVVRAGTVTLGDGVVVNVTGTGTTTVGDNSVTLQKSAVIFDASANYPGLQSNADSKVTITGGTYTTAGAPAVAVYTIESDKTVVNSTTGKSTYASILGGTYNSYEYSSSATSPYTTYKVKVDDGENVIYYTNYSAALRQTASTTYTLTLLADMTTGMTISTTSSYVKGKDITLDMNGHTIGSESVKMGGYILRICNGCTMTLKNGTITSGITTSATCLYGILLGSSSTLTIEDDVTVKVPDDSRASLIRIGNGTTGGSKSTGATLNIEGGTFSGGETWAVSYLGANNTINIEGGTFTAPAGISGNGTSGYSGNTVNVTGGNFTTTSTAILLS